jgi:TPR repeat protein
MKRVIPILLLLLCAISVSAQDLVFNTSLENKAKSGDTNAQVELGVCYQDGLGVDVDLQKAAEWYKKAADKNDLNGLYLYGNLLFTGYGTVKNCKEGFNYLMQAANHGHDDAIAYINRECRLGYEYWGCYDIKPYEYVEYFDVEELIANQSKLKQIAYKSPSASYYLARIAEKQHDYKTAYAYLLQAHKLFYPDDKTYCEEAEDKVDPMTDGDPKCYAIEAYVQDKLGYYSEFGLGCDINYDNAIKYYSQNEYRDGFYPAPGTYVSILRQALCYKKKNDMDSFISHLSKWTWGSSEGGGWHGGFPMANLLLGEAFFTGDGVAVDYKKAFQLFHEITDDDEVRDLDAYWDTYADSCYRLYQMYLKGLGVEQNSAMAKLYFDEAVKYGSTSALYDYAKQKGWR